MNEAELQEVREKKIRTLFDFRSEAEVEKKPDPDIGARYFHVSALTDEAGNEIDLSPEGMKNISEAQMYSPEYFERFLDNFYGTMPFSPAYKIMFREIQAGQTPILFHCSAGKDRTGIGAMLILLALGCSEETALADYMKTNEYRKEKIDAFLAANQRVIELYPDAKDILTGFEGVNRKAAELSLKKIKARYGDYGTFFRIRFNLGEEELQYLRDRYTEKRKSRE